MTPAQLFILALDFDITEADRLWRQGFDTDQIGKQMALPEHVIFNGLRALREERRFQAQTIKRRW